MPPNDIHLNGVPELNRGKLSANVGTMKFYN